MKFPRLASGLVLLLAAVLIQSNGLRMEGRSGDAPRPAASPSAQHTCDGSCRHDLPRRRGDRRPIPDAGPLGELFQAQSGMRTTVALEPGRAMGLEVVGRTMRDDGFVTVSAAVSGGGNLYLVFSGDGARFEGRLDPGDGAGVWALSGGGGVATMERRPLASVLCANVVDGQAVAGLPPLSINGPPEEGGEDGGPLTVAEAQPVLNSLPGANGVIYLDFDGETVSGTQWNASFTNGADIVAPGAGFSDAEIRLVWEVVSEDYRPFNVNITTDRRVFDDYPVNRKTMIIFTPNNEWYGAAGGVAYVDIFGSSFFNEPGWVFTDQLLFNSTPHAPWAAEAASHEAGHVVGLSHDGVGTLDYYEGHGTGATRWGPIMGAAYQVAVSQWSRGEYTGATNTEDDLAIIASSRNGLGYRVDDHAGSTGSATPLDRVGDQVTGAGLIERATDVDVFSVETGGGALTLTGSNFANDPNLDVRLRLLDAQGGEVAVGDPAGGLDATLSASVGAGVYYVVVDGVGTGDPVTGWSDYGSLGGYVISGVVPGVDVLGAEIVSPADPGVSLPEGVGLVIEASATGGVVSWSVVDAPPGGNVMFSSPGSASTRCEFSGPGVYRLRLRADSGSEVVEDDLFVSVEEAGAAKVYANRGPAIDPGPDRNVYNLGLTLDPGAADDGVPGTALGFEWSILSGNASLAGAAEEQPALSFGAPGPVALRVVVSDGAVSTFAELVVNGRFLQEALVDSVAEVAWTVPRNGDEDNSWTLPAYDDRTWQTGIQGVGYDSSNGPSSRQIYLPLIEADIESAMYNSAAGCYVRVPFEVNQAGGVLGLTLRVRYDDGFVAYLNGVQVASGNAPAGADWNSLALSDRDDEAALSFQSFELALPPGVLVDGTNILALHGMNSAVARNERRFLLQGELEATVKESPFRKAVMIVADPQLQDPGDDPDGDGLDNLTEHAGGTDPTVSDGHAFLTVRPGIELALQLPDPLPDDVRYDLEATTDLMDGAWEVVASRRGNAPWIGLQPRGGLPVGGGRVEVLFPAPDAAKFFYRLRFTLVTP